MIKRPKTLTLLPLALAGFAAIYITISYSLSDRHDPEDILHWVQAAGSGDWTAQAVQGEAQAQFYLGLTLIRTNLIIMKDSVPGLENFPLIGKRFQHMQVNINDNSDPDQLREGFRWIKKSANQGYGPARATEELFANTIAELDPADRTEHPPP